jgi:tetratricopeptide (TPR) repeat protein
MEGKAEYARAMARTMQLKPAYEAYDEGRKALAEEDLDRPLAKANEALDQFPGEAHFHALRGDVRLVQDNYDWAATNYTRAIERREDFFYYHLQRGIARKELGQQTEAVADLERSLALLPTAPAHYALGDIAQDRGDLPRAIEHYKVVAKAGGDYGKMATAQLARIELPSNPAAYIPSGCSADGNAKLIVSVRNDTPMPITGVQVAVSYTDAAGQRQQPRFSISGQIEPGQVASVNTGLGPYTAGSDCPAEVVAARIVE